MVTNHYLKWLSETDSFWWNDSADLASMDQAIENGATGVTTNPLLVKRSLDQSPDFWRPFLGSALGRKGDEKAEEIIRCVTVEIAKKFLPIYEASMGAQGYVCAQVNPSYQGDLERMVEMGKRLAGWAKNIAVKLPATAAGLCAIEELSALGVTTVGTVSFSVSQAVAVAGRQQAGLARCRAAGRAPGKAFSVIMVGRLDDYIRDVANDSRLEIPDEDIRLSGTACIKRAYALCRQLGYEAKLMPAGMRGAYHAKALAGADMSMSLSSGIQSALGKENDLAANIEQAVPLKSIDRLCGIKEFVKAYEPDGMAPSDFIAFGATQRTLSQFMDAGWNPIAAWPLCAQG